jgi:hypothetical protein
LKFGLFLGAEKTLLMKHTYLRLLSLFLFAISFATDAISQHSHTHSDKCGFDLLHRQKMEEDAEYRRLTEEFNQMPMVSTSARSGVYKVPIVVHILHRGEAVGTGTNISEEQVRAGIKNLNEQWRKIAGTVGDGNGVDMEIEFVLAVRNPSGGCTNGIVRRNMSGNSIYMSCGVTFNGSCGITDTDAKTGRWNTQRYYNIYLVDKIGNANCSSTSGYVAGYAFLASSHGTANDGVVLLICSFLEQGSTSLAHELGHALNLFHTFEGDNGGTTCPSQQNGCGLNAGDCCADTPPHIRTSAIANLYFDCNNNTSNNCAAGTTRQDHMRNYMDYTGCANEFTPNQKSRCVTALTVTRSSFLPANGNLSLVPPGNASVNFTASSTVACTGSFIDFTDFSSCVPNSFTNTGHPNHTFLWSFTGPATINSSLQNPRIQFNTPGTYNVTLSITNNQGTFTHTKNGFITVTAAPVNACTPTSTNAGNFGQTVSNVTFNTINNSTSPIFNVAYTNFSCTHATLVNEGSTHPISITVNSGPSGGTFFEVYIDYNNNGVFEATERVFNGDTGGSNRSATRTGNITIPSTAVKNTLLRMRVMSEVGAAPNNNKRNCTQAYSIGDVEDYGVYIKSLCDPPNAPGNITGSNDVCAGTTHTYSIAAVSGATSYVWSVPSGATINSGQGSTSVSVTFGSNSGSVSVVSVNSCSNSPSSLLNVNVNPSTPPSVTIQSDVSGNSICSGDAVQFTATAQNAGTSPSYQWTVNGTPAGSNNSTFTSSTLSDGDEISCTITSSNACASPASSSSNTITMEVFTINTTVLVNNNQFAAQVTDATYQWLDCNNALLPIIGEEDRIFIAQNEGNYAVLISQDGCQSISPCNEYSTTPPLSISNREFSIALYPNPNSGSFNVDLGKVSANSTITITDILGKVIRVESAGNRQLVTLELKTSPGVYFATIKTGSESTVIRFTIH